MQMQQLELEEGQNPLIYATPMGAVVLYINNSINDNIVPNIEDSEIEIFNGTYTKYEGVQKGSAVKSLIDTVKTNNLVYEEHQISINNITKSEDLDKLKQNVENTSEYNIALSKDEAGYINGISLTK